MGKGKGPWTRSHLLWACHISPPETGFLRSLNCGQLHFVRQVFLTLPRENSCCCRSRLKQTTHPAEIQQACESTKLEAKWSRILVFSEANRNLIIPRVEEMVLL